MSTLSPSEKGNELPLAMADATADLRKSISRCVPGDPCVYHLGTRACLDFHKAGSGRGPGENAIGTGEDEDTRSRCNVNWRQRIGRFVAGELKVLLFKNCGDR